MGNSWQVWLGSVVIAALISGLMNLPKVRGEGRQADAAGEATLTEAQLKRQQAILERADRDIANAEKAAVDAKAACDACEKRRQADAEHFESEMAQMRGVVEMFLDGSHQLLAMLRSGHSLDPEVIDDFDAVVDTARRELWRLR